MLRRSHRKSRAGCVQCKRRHVKCDERRPTCLLCSMSERECSFASQPLPQTHSSPASFPPSSNGETSRSSSGDTSNTPNGSGSGSAPTPPSSADEPINLDHMKLLIHLTLSPRAMFNLLECSESLPSVFSSALTIGLESPYLLYQLLAFSARHLAHLHPDQSASYAHQAVALQTRALSLFNTAITGMHMDQSNCVPVLLFSTTLGHHLLADTLSNRSPGGLDTFLAHYLQCAELHRGIHTIAITAEPLLLKSELSPILSRNWDSTSRPSAGTHTNSLRDMVDSSPGLGIEEKKACHAAIHYLQLGFDEQAGNEGTRYQMIFLWTVVVPVEFTRLLAARRPEALVVLGYYALLLHLGRRLWQVGDAGVYVLGLVRGYLGAEWDGWLEYPCRGVYG